MNRGGRQRWHGAQCNRKYHPDCVKAIRSRTTSANNASRSNRKRIERQAAMRPEPPADHRSHQIRVRGVAHSLGRIALRAFVDDGLALVALLGDVRAWRQPGCPSYDLLAGIDSAVKRHVRLVRW